MIVLSEAEVQEAGALGLSYEEAVTAKVCGITAEAYARRKGELQPASAEELAKQQVAMFRSMAASGALSPDQRRLLAVKLGLKGVE
jgi:hypothetical protein